MNWKSISKGLVIFCTGFIVGQLVGWNPTIESMKGTVISGSLIVLAILVGLLRGSDILGAISNYFKGRKEDKEKSKQNKLSHAKRDLEPEFKIMAESKIRSNYDLKLYINRESKIRPAFDYSEEANAHLDEYKTACVHKEERDINIEKHNKIIQPFLVVVSEKIINTFEQKFPLIVKWSRLSGDWQKLPMKSNDLEIVSKEVAKIIRGSYETEGEIDSGWDFKFAENQWELYARLFVIESGTESEIKEIKLAIETVLKEVSTGEEFNNIRKYYKGATNSHKLFVDDINKIRKEVQSDIPLKGQCNICKKY